jgi:ribosomal protein S18 acetylase RimI-like enzyme
VLAPLDIRRVRSAADWLRARALVETYAAGLGVDLAFQGFEAEVADLARAYARPGGMWLAARARTALGCVGLRRLAEGLGELKRLYVLPAARGGGVGRALVRAALAAARRAGFRAVRLDTLPEMESARALYRTFGFQTTTPYRENPVPGAAFLELVLSPAPRRAGPRPRRSPRRGAGRPRGRRPPAGRGRR